MKTISPCVDGFRFASKNFRRVRGDRRGGEAEVRPSVALFVRPQYRDIIFSPAIVSEIDGIAGRPSVWVDPDKARLCRPILSECEILFCSWGTPRLDRAFLATVPNLRAVFYASGSADSLLTEELFARGITVTSAQAAQAKPVVELSTSVILRSLKYPWTCMRETHRVRSWNQRERMVPGADRSTVGLITLGATGQGVVEVLSRHNLKVIAYDPNFSAEQASALGAELTSLERVFSESDVISIHSPVTPSTSGLIGSDLLNRMKSQATLINAACGATIRPNALCKVLQRRKDLSVVLDVANAEPPDLDSPLWNLPNVFFTPHSSGSLGGECLRMSRFLVDEFRRYSRGIPLLHRVTPREWKK